MAQCVEPPTSAQVMISQSVGSSPGSGSLPSAWSLLGILSYPVSLPLPCLLSLSLFLSKINIKKCDELDYEIEGTC